MPRHGKQYGADFVSQCPLAQTASRTKTKLTPTAVVSAETLAQLAAGVTTALIVPATSAIAAFAVSYSNFW